MPDDEELEDVARRLREKLAAYGVSDDDLQAAAAEGLGGLRRLVARHMSFPGDRRYTPADVYAKAGVDEETSRALWRAMGFPEVPDDEPAFTDADVEALEVAFRLFDRTRMDRAIILQQTRSMGLAAARIAAAHQDVIADLIPEGDPLRAAEEAMALSEEARPALEHLLVYMYRRHLAAATEQRMLVGPTDEGGVPMSVGFADLSGFTSLSRELDVREVAALVDRFNASATDVIVRGGGRVIKTIGDEVMFSATDPGAAASISLGLIEEVSATGGLPRLKVGLASGVVIMREGDVFGSPVNLANRLVTLARPESVLVDPATREALGRDERFRFSSVGPRRLKGIGHVKTYRLRRAEPEPALRTRR